ncbi:MAG: Maf family nucleotide pyrophosphatase [Pelagimonas sp.]|jgi:septum formation protein|nr:Maf family nucleotide pyrophosphatase [Pelagimonas sp.]
MSFDLILASGSRIRADLLKNAGLAIEIESPRVDEESLKQALLQEEANPRDIADALAEAKAAKISRKFPDAYVLGCDQVLEHDGQILSKPTSRQEARDQIVTLAGKTHKLLSAAVLYHETQPVWRHVSIARLTMKSLSDDYLEAYLDRNWPDIGTSVGGYKLEKEGVRLFSRIHGDHFTILGMPLIELLNYLAIKGVIQS